MLALAIEINKHFDLDEADYLLYNFRCMKRQTKYRKENTSHEMAMGQ